MMDGLPNQLASFKHALVMLPVAATLGGALGVIRPIRRSLVSRSSHVIQAQVLLAVVGAVVMIIVAESLARAFAIAGAAGLVRYRAQIDDPKEAGVLLVSGTGLFAVAAALCVFVILLLWIVESLEPPDRAQFDLVISSRESLKIRQQVEHAFRGKDVHYQLWGSSPDELRYEVSVPFDQDIKKLAKIIKRLDGKAPCIDHHCYRRDVCHGRLHPRGDSSVGPCGTDLHRCERDLSRRRDWRRSGRGSARRAKWGAGADSQRSHRAWHGGQCRVELAPRGCCLR
jgi:hypothetical protein